MNRETSKDCWALPAPGKGNGILLLHAWWGINDTLRQFAMRLAAEGYTVYAPDLYHGKVATQVEQAEVLSSGVFNHLKDARAEIAAACEALLHHPATSGNKIAVLGFSMGAFFALDIAEHLPERIQSVVVYYGTRPGPFTATKAAYLGHFAETDEFEPAETVEQLSLALQQANRPYTFYLYPGTSHWFAEADQAAYNAQAAETAWLRTKEFLQRTFPTR